MSYNSIRGISPTCEFKNGFVEKLCRFEFPMKTGNDHISIEMCSPVDYLKKIDQMAETKSGAYAEEVGRMVREFVSNLSPDTAYDRRWEKIMHDTQSSQNPQGKFALGAVLGALSPVHADLCAYLARLDKRARKLERAIADHERCAADEATRRAHFRQILLQEHADVEVVLSRLTGLVEAEKSVRTLNDDVKHRKGKMEKLENNVPKDLKVALCANPQFESFVRELMRASRTAPSTSLPGGFSQIFALEGSLA
ncbi:hypothetical protein CYMTET_47321 [Cymbomonas tetramitiformis]|uniref:Uncharacterized protein n=1 Tax=Cymbomonas tetramitiformis TaxID=36881 RepID=A0AAE0ELB9_9CHLO|nr:hypothetical protein CYMTET_57054 [Cymbomonas tetramitiformis]KAK3243052.1 hypothetical protein CYMTET_47321 [Cymbomonas tetramitiformis]